MKSLEAQARSLTARAAAIYQSYVLACLAAAVTLHDTDYGPLWDAAVTTARQQTDGGAK